MSYTDIPCPFEFLRTNTTDLPFGENDGHDSSSSDSVNLVSFGMPRAYNHRSPLASENTIVSPFGDTSKETFPCSMVLDAGQPASCTENRAKETRMKCRIGKFRILYPNNRTGVMCGRRELSFHLRAATTAAPSPSHGSPPSLGDNNASIRRDCRSEQVVLERAFAGKSFRAADNEPSKEYRVRCEEISKHGPCWSRHADEFGLVNNWSIGI